MEDARKIETINFNPAVDCVLATSSQDALNLWDIIAAEQIYSFEVSILYLTAFKTVLQINSTHKAINTKIATKNWF